MRPTVDIHYRPESMEDTSLSFILQKPRGLLTENLVEDLDTYVNDLDFCKYIYFWGMAKMINIFFIVFVRPVRGLLREILDYLIEDDNSVPFEKWLSKLTDYMAPGPVLE